MKKITVVLFLASVFLAASAAGISGNDEQTGQDNGTHILSEEVHHDHTGAEKDLSARLKNFADKKSPQFFIIAFLTVFFYGVLHGLSLAHGGSVISAWVLASRRTFKNVVTASLMTGFFHAFSAVLVVFATWFFLERFIPHEKLQHYIKYIAGAVIIGVGISVLYGFINAKINGTCGHCHGHKNRENTENDDGINPFLVAFAAGIMPCPVTSVIVIAFLGFGLIWHSLVFAAGFAAGMGSAILGIAAVIWYLREKAGALKLEKVSDIIENILPLISAGLFVFIGIYLIT